MRTRQVALIISVRKYHVTVATKDRGGAKGRHQEQLRWTVTMNDSNSDDGTAVLLAIVMETRAAVSFNQRKKQYLGKI